VTGGPSGTKGARPRSGEGLAKLDHLLRFSSPWPGCVVAHSLIKSAPGLRDGAPLWALVHARTDRSRSVVLRVARGASYPKSSPNLSTPGLVEGLPGTPSFLRCRGRSGVVSTICNRALRLAFVCCSEALRRRELFCVSWIVDRVRTCVRAVKGGGSSRRRAPGG